MKKELFLFALFMISLCVQAQDQTINGKLKVTSTADVGAGQDPALLIGNRTGLHIGIDGNEIGAFNNNNSTTLYLNANSNSHTAINYNGTGNVGIGTNNPSAKLHINSNADVGAGQNPALLVGNRAGFHIGIDGNEIGAFNNNIDATLFLNANSTSNTLLNYNGTGGVGIGTTNPGSWKLAVNGNIRAKEVKVETGWSDFVFYDDYKLPTLEEVEMHIEEKGHLKDIPSEKEVEENGILIGEMNAKLLQKIEELTLYTIEQEKEIKNIKKENKLLKSLFGRVSKLEKEIENQK